MGSNRVTRKDAVSIADAIKLWLSQARLAPQHNSYRIALAWDQASGAAKYTIKRYYRDGKLFITVDSSVVRNQLSFQKKALVEKMNRILEEDELFISRGLPAIRELILK